MKNVIFILLLLGTYTLQAQVKTIRGRLTNNDTIPLSEVNFHVQNRNISGKTDKEGYFILKNVVNDDVIVVNNTNTEFKVQNIIISILSEKPIPVGTTLIESAKDTLGVKHMTDNMGRGNSYRVFDKIHSIDEKHNSHIVQEVRPRSYYSGYTLNYSGFIDVGIQGRLPQLQSEYAQGQGNNWQGADMDEIFSWGPKIANLKYSGTSYPYDKNGMLIPLGSGEGNTANTYNPKDFFRTGVSFGNSVNVKFRGFGSGLTSLSLGQKKSNSPIPGAYAESYNTSLMHDLKIGNVKTNIGARYNSSYERLPQHGANLATLMYSVLTTPPTFDNMNGLTRKQAVNGTEAWLLNNGTQRSYAPNHVDNPFLLISKLPDRDKSDELVLSAQGNYTLDRFTALVHLSFDKSWNKRYNGTATVDNAAPRQTYRYEDLSNIIASTDLSYKVTEDNPNLFLMANYGFKRTTDKLFRNDGRFIPAPLETTMDRILNRNAHDVKYGAKLTDYNYTIELQNKHYFSNTSKSSDYLNLFPEAGFNWNLEDFIYETFDKYDKYYTLYGSIGRSIGESPLVYRNPAALSIMYKAEDFRDYYEYSDIFHHKGLKPETYLKTELGLKFKTPNYRFNAEVNGFYYTTQDFIAPIMSSSIYTPSLQNIGRIHNYGYFVSLDYSKGGGNNSFNFDTRLNFSQYRSKVSAVYSDQPFIPLAGFSEIATVFAKDQPLGAIYGTTYQRNGQGQVVIGNDGFPMVDNTMKKIGDPTPDFLVTLAPRFGWRNFNLSFTIEYSHGGERWNGTKAFLDYHGMSEETAKKRNTTGYVFDGVDQSGNKNTKPVDFYNSNKPLSENRWVKYGAGGVGEEYIEKATYVRLSDVWLTYNVLRNRGGRLFKSMQLGLKAQNLILITPYKGVDPSSSLFGYSSGAGLDLFNQPSTRNYSFILTFEL